MKKCDGQNITRRGVRCCAAAQVPDKILCSALAKNAVKTLHTSFDHANRST